MAALEGSKAVDRQGDVLQLSVNHQPRALWQGLEVVAGAPCTNSATGAHCMCVMGDEVFSQTCGA